MNHKKLRRLYRKERLQAGVMAGAGEPYHEGADDAEVPKHRPCDVVTANRKLKLATSTDGQQRINSSLLCFFLNLVPLFRKGFEMLALA
jgi:hypothetical protein